MCTSAHAESDAFADLQDIEAACGPAANDARPYALVLGIAQDAGYPQAGCRGSCCERAWGNPDARRLAACLALVDPPSGGRWLIDATPDFREQLRMLDEASPPGGAAPDLGGILLTHAHTGHYTGLIHLGREAMDAPGTPVYAMPRMSAFLQRNAPWSELAANGNIELRPLGANRSHRLSPSLAVTPLLVPHRDEASETVAFKIEGTARTALYVPDIDDWARWDRPIEQLLREVDVAYLDGTFYDDAELPGGDLRDVPHPTMSATMERLGDLPDLLRARVRFIHLNHTNPAIMPGGDAARRVSERGFALADEGERFQL